MGRPRAQGRTWNAQYTEHSAFGGRRGAGRGCDRHHGGACAGAGQDLRDEAVDRHASTTPSTSGSSGLPRRSRRTPAAASRARSIRRASSARSRARSKACSSARSRAGWVRRNSWSASTIRYEAMSAPGLFTSPDQADAGAFTIAAVQKMLFALGEAKGLEGVGLAPIGPSSIAMRKEVKTLADLKGIEDPRARLAVPARADPPHGRVAGGDDACRRVAGPAAGHDRRRARRHHRLDARSSTRTRPNTSSTTTSPTSIRSSCMSKRWIATLPPDLQKIVRDNAVKVSQGHSAVREGVLRAADAMSGRARAA